MCQVVAFVALLLALAVASDLDLWSEFKRTYHKSYPSSNGEEAERFAVFRSNLREAEKLQELSTSAVFGVTQFMDLTQQEFRRSYLNLNASARTAATRGLPRLPRMPAGTRVPTVDWRGKAVTSVKNQASCSSCWAFSAAAAIEGCWALKGHGTGDSVSVQQIMDCTRDVPGVGQSCDGGFNTNALGWAVQQDLASWGDYNYTAKDSTDGCHAGEHATLVPKGTCEFQRVYMGEEALQEALLLAPVSIAMATRPFQYYKGGIIDGELCMDRLVDHAVLLVGDEGNAYTIKNSWGSSWGEEGYLRVVKGFEAEHGYACLEIASDGESAVAL